VHLCKDICTFLCVCTPVSANGRALLLPSFACVDKDRGLTSVGPPTKNQAHLVAHLTREHYSCHLCERIRNSSPEREEGDVDGGGSRGGRGRGRGRGSRGARGGGERRGVQGRQDVEFFREYSDLETHFREKHLLCRDPECLALRYVVFATHDEYRVHFVNKHAGRLQRSDRAQLLSVTNPLALPFPAPSPLPASLATSSDSGGTSSCMSARMHVTFDAGGGEARSVRQGRGGARGTGRRGRGTGRAGRQLEDGGRWCPQQEAGDETQSGGGGARGRGGRGGRLAARGMRRGEDRGRGRGRGEVAGVDRSRWGEDGRMQASANGMHLGINVTQLRERYALELGASAEGVGGQARRREWEVGAGGDGRTDFDGDDDGGGGKGASRTGRVREDEDSEVEFPSLVPKVVAPPERGWGVGSGLHGTDGDDRETRNEESSIRWEQSMASRLFDATEIDLGAINDSGGGGVSGGIRQNDFPPLPNATRRVPSGVDGGAAAGMEVRGTGGPVVANEISAMLSALGVSEAHVKVKSKKAAHGVRKTSLQGATGPGGEVRLGGEDVGWSREKVVGQKEPESGKQLGSAGREAQGAQELGGSEREEFPQLPRADASKRGGTGRGAPGWEEIVMELVGEEELDAIKKGLSALRRGDVTAATCYSANEQSFESLGQVMPAAGLGGGPGCLCLRCCVQTEKDVSFPLQACLPTSVPPCHLVHSRSVPSALRRALSLYVITIPLHVHSVHASDREW